MRTESVSAPYIGGWMQPRGRVLGAATSGGHRTALQRPATRGSVTSRQCAFSSNAPLRTDDAANGMFRIAGEPFAVFTPAISAEESVAEQARETFRISAGSQGFPNPLSVTRQARSYAESSPST